MLFRSSMYKRCYPFKQSMDIQTLGEKDRELLAKWIRQFPAELKALEFELVKRSGTRDYMTPFSLDELRHHGDALADKVSKGSWLSVEEVKDANAVLFSHKYNAFWHILLPMPIKKDHT